MTGPIQTQQQGDGWMPALVLQSLGMQVLEHGDGAASGRIPLHDGLRLADGRFPAGLAVLVGDNALGRVANLHAAGRAITNAYTVDLMADIPVDGTHLVAAAAQVGRYGPDLLIAGAVTSGDGQPVARISAWWHDSQRITDRPPTDPSHPGPAADDVIPQRLLPPAADLDADRSPIAALLGLSLTAAGADSITVEQTVIAPFLNVGEALHGGVAGLVASLVVEGLLAGTSGTVRVLRVDLHYLRPVGVDLRPVPCRAEVVRRGRAMALADATLMTPDGRPGVVARVSAAIPPPG